MTAEPPEPVGTDPALLVRARALAATGRRTMLGITGPPGSGKSTLAEELVSAVGPAARLVAMDGFHLAEAELRRLGRRDRKGAPDTFDPAGFVALLQRLRARSEPVVYAPRFDRAIEEAIGGAIAVPRETALVVVEGNYLLLDSGGWGGVRHLLDECWYINLPEGERHTRLHARHVHFGRTPEEAWARTLGSDERNAELIESSRDRADLVIGAGTAPLGSPPR